MVPEGEAEASAEELVTPARPMSVHQAEPDVLEAEMDPPGCLESIYKCNIRGIVQTLDRIVQTGVNAMRCERAQNPEFPARGGIHRGEGAEAPAQTEPERAANPILKVLPNLTLKLSLPLGQGNKKKTSQRSRGYNEDHGH